MASTLWDLCVSATFEGLTIPAGEVLAIDATRVTNFSIEALEFFRFTQPTRNLTNANFCNVTVTYTHPGQNDQIGVETWLPLDGWNERLQSAGGGGFYAGRYVGTYGNMYGALADGYATSTTDAGLLPGESNDPNKWAQVSPGNVNLYNLQNLGSVSLGDQVNPCCPIIVTSKSPTYNLCRQSSPNLLSRDSTAKVLGILIGTAALKVEDRESC